MINILVVTWDQLPTTFFDSENLARFWFYVKWTLAFLMPIIMICLAALTADKVLDMVLGVFGRTTEQEADDEDDYETRYY